MGWVQLSYEELHGYIDKIDDLEMKNELYLKTLKEIAAHARRETNGLKEYEGDTYGFIYKKAMSVISE